MPLVDSNDPSLWDGGPNSLYQAQPFGTIIGYQRQVMSSGGLCYIGDDAKLLIQALVALGMTAGQRIALVGAGFGWVAEEFLAQGFGPIADGTTNGRLAATDTSTWIQNNKNSNAVVNILNADVNASTGRNAIKSAFGLKGNVKIDWIVTEDVLPLLIGTGPTPAGNNEIQPFSSACRQLATKVAHWVTPRYGDGSAQDTRLNWKSLSEWKAWVTPDFVIQRGATTTL